MAKFHECANLPEPSINQGVFKATNRFGCFYSLRDRRPKPTNLWAQNWWNGYYNKNIRAQRRQLMRQIGLAWNAKLSGTQRTAWEALAGSITWTNYNGDAHTGNGFELFVAVQTERRYTYGVPWFQFSFPTWPIFLDPPSPWDPPAAPAMTNPALSFDAWFQIEVTNAPANSEWWSAAPYIQKGHSAAGVPHRPYGPARDFLSDFGSDPPLLYVPVDFPWFTLDHYRGCSVGYRFLNLNTGVFSDPSWIDVA
jgi:hypothetical protein